MRRRGDGAFYPQQVSVSDDHALALTGDRALKHAVVVLVIGQDVQALGRPSHTVWVTSPFGSDGEWREARVLQVQFQGIVGHDAHQFKDGSRQAVVSPHTMTSGPLIDPYLLAI